ncbi:unnamed protein product, partial [Closterium sp. NIES-53]
RGVPGAISHGGAPHSSGGQPPARQAISAEGEALPSTTTFPLLPSPCLSVCGVAGAIGHGGAPHSSGGQPSARQALPVNHHSSPLRSLLLSLLCSQPPQFAESLVPSATVGRPTAAEDSHQHVKRRAPASGGCNIEGFVLVKKVPGNLMITAHSTAHSFDAATMNMTHSIHRFTFGRQLTRRKQELVARLRPYVPAPVGRLEGHSFHSNHDNVTHEHFMQIVLTEVHPLGVSRKDSSLHSYDYTAHSHTLQAPSVPVSRFHYELSPMQVHAFRRAR